MTTIEDLLDRVKSWNEKLGYANVCQSMSGCAFPEYYPMLREMLSDGKISLTDVLVKIIYMDPLCGGCNVVYKAYLPYMGNINIAETMEELRAIAVELGKGPMPAHKRLAESVEENRNPYHRPHEDRFKWMPEGIKPKEDADVAYFVGCTSAYRRPEIAQATVKILDASGTDFMILGRDEWCCGSTLLRTGQVELAKKMMEHNVDVLNKSGVGTVITSCAGCYNALKRDYPKYGMEGDFDVIHSSEYINQLLKEGKLKLKKELPMKVTFHDSCHLNARADRSTGVYEPPREILREISGLELVEMERIKEHAWCCGAGGGVKSAFPNFALRSAKERLEEVKRSGAEMLVACCPFCVRNFDDVAKEKGEIEVADLTTLVAMAMGD
jgi:Fe-S oxidoreductase